MDCSNFYYFVSLEAMIVALFNPTSAMMHYCFLENSILRNSSFERAWSGLASPPPPPSPSPVRATLRGTKAAAGPLPVHEMRQQG